MSGRDCRVLASILSHPAPTPESAPPDASAQPKAAISIFFMAISVS
jgi:hypothetical protein